MSPPAIARRTLRRDDAFPIRSEALGFVFHSPEEREYWARDACYAVTPEAVAAMDSAARELNGMITAAVDRVVASARASPRWWRNPTGSANPRSMAASISGSIRTDR